MLSHSVASLGRHKAQKLRGEMRSVRASNPSRRTEPDATTLYAVIWSQKNTRTTLLSSPKMTVALYKYHKVAHYVHLQSRRLPLVREISENVADGGPHNISKRHIRSFISCRDMKAYALLKNYFSPPCP